MKQKTEFVWRITASHTIAYFIAGLLALVLMEYKKQFGDDFMSVIMRPVDSPWIALGAGLQVFRGMVMALVLLPFREIIVYKNGWIKLLALILGLSYFATIGPTFGSFDGYIYTKIPIQYHLLGLPETLIYSFLFTSMFALWHKMKNKALNIISASLVALIVLMSVMGLLASLGKI